MHITDYIWQVWERNIVEQGSHDELLKLNGKYAQMWKVQAGAYVTV